MVISAERLEKLKELFAEDGIELTDVEALEIGLWLLARIQPVFTSVPLDKMPLFATIKEEEKAIRSKVRFVSLSEVPKRSKKRAISPPN